MTELFDLPQIFAAYYSGATRFPYPPIRTNSHQNRYVGFFINTHGEKWIFIYDDELGGGILLGNDCNWEILPLGNGNAPVANDLSLGEDEALWLQSCWMASAHLRKDEKGDALPWDMLTLGLAAISWSIPISKLREPVTDGEPVARKLGNTWITTISAMTKAYGTPKRDLSFSRVIGEEIDRLSKQDTEEIRRKLMEE